MRNLFFLFFLFISKAALSQDTLYYDFDGQEVKTISTAAYYEIKVKDQSNPDKTKTTSYYKSGKIRSERESINFNGLILFIGKVKYWYENGQLKSEANHEEGVLNGKVISYWDNGVLKRNDTFKDGKLLDGNCYNSDGVKTVHYDYEIMPEFPGGINKLLQFIASNVQYPKKSRRSGAQGTAIVQFWLEKDGKASNATIINSVDKYIDAEALRVVSKMPKWQPGMQDGEAVRVLFTLPIKFFLQ